MCVVATVVAIIVLYLYLRAENKPVTAMPAWVSRQFCDLHNTFVFSAILLSHSHERILRYSVGFLLLQPYERWQLTIYYDTTR